MAFEIKGRMDWEKEDRCWAPHMCSRHLDKVSGDGSGWVCQRKVGFNNLGEGVGMGWLICLEGPDVRPQYIDTNFVVLSFACFLVSNTTILLSIWFVT